MPSAWPVRNCRQLCPTRRVDTGPAEDQPDRAGRQPVAEPDQFAMNSSGAPAGILRGHPQHQLPDGGPGRRPAAAARNRPPAADQIAMPAQHRLRRDE